MTDTVHTPYYAESERVFKRSVTTQNLDDTTMGFEICCAADGESAHAIAAALNKPETAAERDKLLAVNAELASALAIFCDATRSISRLLSIRKRARTAIAKAEKELSR